MAGRYVLIDEILKNHYERELNLRKFYPFFILQQTGFRSFQEGRFASIDMGYLVMASLGFFIHENSLNEREVSYEIFADFMRELLLRDFPLVFEKNANELGTPSAYQAGKDEEDDDIAQLIRYFFDRLTNGGKAFSMDFYDPESKSTRTARVRLIDSLVREKDVIYQITEDGIEFYLSTKEMKDESRISTEQLLLEKLIRAENFRGSIDVIERINVEVRALEKRCDEIKKLLLTDVKAGTAEVDAFMDRTSKWFDEEKKSFAKNRALADKALARIRGDGAKNAARDIVKLEYLLQQTIQNHSRLIANAAELTTFADEMVRRSRQRSLLSTFSFSSSLRRMERVDRADLMEQVLAPFFLPKRYQSLTENAPDHMVLDNVRLVEKNEIRERRAADLDFEYDDEKLSRTVGQNFAKMFTEICERFDKWDAFDLKELTAILEIRFSQSIYRNRDYYSFFTQLAEKPVYKISDMLEKQETFLEELVVEHTDKKQLEKYKDLSFRLAFPDELVSVEKRMDPIPADAHIEDEFEGGRFALTNIQFIKQ